MMAGTRARRAWTLVGVATALLVVLVPAPNAQGPATSTFGADVAALSEPGGYFDTDNLISNERSYLHVVPALRDARVSRAARTSASAPIRTSRISRSVRPSIAFIVDMRRDNLLLHLLFKALFELSRNAGRLPRAAVRPCRARPTRRLAGRRSGRDRRPTSRARLAEPAIAELRARVTKIELLRPAVLGRPTSPDHRPLSPAVHRRRVAAASFRRTGRRRKAITRRIAICCSRPTARAGGGTFSPQRTTFSSCGARTARSRHPRRRRSRRSVSAGPDRTPDDRARRTPVRLLCVERRVLPVRRRQLRSSSPTSHRCPAPTPPSSFGASSAVGRASLATTARR